MILKEKDIFNVLIRQHGFYVEEYDCNNKKRWIALKNVENGIYAVITSNTEEADCNYKSAMEYLNNKGFNYSLNNIIIKKDTGIYCPISEENVLVYNSTNNSIEYCDSSCNVLLRIINGMQIDTNTSTKFNFKWSTTNIIIAINVVIFIIECILSRSVTDIDVDVLVLMGAKVNEYIKQGQIFRLFTPMFLHGGIMHLLCNMYSLYSLGDLVERIFGRKKYILLYLITGVCSDVLSFLISPYISVGASGAIFGLLGAVAVFAFFNKDKIGRGFIINIASVIAINIFIGLSQTGIDNAAHFGGLISGMILSLIFYKKQR